MANTFVLLKSKKVLTVLQSRYKLQKLGNRQRCYVHIIPKLNNLTIFVAVHVQHCGLHVRTDTEG